MQNKSLILLSKDYRTKTVLSQLTEKQNNLIKAKHLIPLWESQTWLSWKDKYNNSIDDFNKHFLEYYNNSDDRDIELFALLSIKDNIWGMRLKFVFITPKLDKKLSEGINNNYQYKNHLRKDLMDKTHYDKLQSYIKKYKILSENVMLDINNDEVDEYCNACDMYPEMVNIKGFILHNILGWK